MDEFDDLLGLETESGDVVSAEDLAAWLGVSTRVVRDLAQRGIITKAGKGNYPLRDGIKAYCTHIREQGAGRAGSNTLTAERLRAVREQADKLALQNAATRGEMLSARTVESTWATTLHGVRAAMLAIPSRIQTRLSSLTAQDVAVIDREIRDALTEAAQG
jgi:phage terminase Nu1 subunit (DNA packaging protein)